MIRLAIVGAVAVGIVLLNLCCSSRNSVAFEQRSFPEAFGPSRGWPANAVAPANEEGVDLVRGSVVQGGSTVYRDVSKDPRYPHLAVNWELVVFNLGVAGVFIFLAWFIPRYFRSSRRQPAGIQ